MSTTQTAAKIGKGTILAMGDVAASPTYTPIAEVFELPFPEIEHPDVEATHYQSPDGMEETINGWATAQDMEVQLNYTPTQYAALLLARGTQKAFKITLPDTATITFNANVKKVGGAIPNKDRMTNTITLKPTTKPAFAGPSGGSST